MGPREFAILESAMAKKKAAKKTDHDRIKRLAEELRAEVAGLEGTHPQIVQAVNALCVMLSRLGI